jgi:methyl coenzyme M reductase gamma subunit
MPADFFFPDTVRIAGLAFDDAVRTLPETPSEEVKNLLARRILGTVSLGGRDIVEMRDDGVAYVSS